MGRIYGIIVVFGENVLKEKNHYKLKNGVCEKKGLRNDNNVTRVMVGLRRNWKINRIPVRTYTVLFV